MIDEPEIASELVALAEAYEAKAKRLRDAAAVLASEPSAFRSGVAEVPVRRAEAARERARALTGREYEKVIAAEPARGWEPATLAEAMREEYGVEVRKEAARTMLYRLEDRGSVVKSGRGTWVYAQPQPSDALGIDLQEAPIRGVD